MPAPYLITLKGYRPAERLPPVTTPWTHADVYENGAGPVEEGKALIQSISLATLPGGLDVDPKAPAVRDFSVNAAQLESAWYQVVFRDAGGASSPTEWEAASGAGIFLPPSAGLIRDRSPYLKSLYPESPFDADREWALREVIADAVALVQSLTCRTLDAALAADPQLGRLALRAVQLKAERIASPSARTRRTQLNAGRLRSISAGPWSESYFGPGDAEKARRLDPDDATHEVLWALATEECREKWLALWTGEYAPAGYAQEFDWFPEARGGY